MPPPPAPAPTQTHARTHTDKTNKQFTSNITAA